MPRRYDDTNPELLTECWIIEDLSFGRKEDENLSSSMGILTWKKGEVEEKGVELVDDGWLRAMRAETWNSI